MQSVSKACKCKQDKRHQWRKMTEHWMYHDHHHTSDDNLLARHMSAVWTMHACLFYEHHPLGENKWIFQVIDEKCVVLFISNSGVAVYLCTVAVYLCTDAVHLFTVILHVLEACLSCQTHSTAKTLVLHGQRSTLPSPRINQIPQGTSVSIRVFWLLQCSKETNFESNSQHT